MKIYLLTLTFALTISVFSSESEMPNTNAQTMLLVHKTPTCGCCKKWIKHLEMSGLNTTTKNHESLEEIKATLLCLFRNGSLLTLCPYAHMLRAMKR